MNIIVASTNPVKINAVKTAFEKMFAGEEFFIEEVAVESGVAGQPMSEEETMRGARNRVAAARIQKSGADFFVAIEGGIEDRDNEMKEVAWIVVQSRDGREGKGRVGAFFLPSKMAALIREGKEMGEASDAMFDDHNSKQKSGAVGHLTHGVIDRTELYVPAIIFALIPFKNPELYF